MKSDNFDNYFGVYSGASHAKSFSAGAGAKAGLSAEGKFGISVLIIAAAAASSPTKADEEAGAPRHRGH